MHLGASCAFGRHLGGFGGLGGGAGTIGDNQLPKRSEINDSIIRNGRLGSLGASGAFGMHLAGSGGYGGGPEAIGGIRWQSDPKSMIL